MQNQREIMQRPNKKKAALLCATLIFASLTILVAGSVVASSSTTQRSRAAADSSSQLAASPFTPDADGYVTVSIRLALPAPSKLSTAARRSLSSLTRSPAKARRAAQGSPHFTTIPEQQVAHQLEKNRNAALPELRRATAKTLKAQERVRVQIQTLGGRIVKTPSLPGSLIVRLPANRLDDLRSLKRVDDISNVQLPQPMTFTFGDGSVTWQANGFKGQSPNPDRPTDTDGPDVVISDTGITTAHLAFNSRLSTDCASCNGTGPRLDPNHTDAQTGPHSRIISPKGRTDFVGDDHGNTIAATIANTNLARGAAGTGMAYGIDKLYDIWQAKDWGYWQIGITVDGEPGVTDLPEVMNYSQGIYDDTVGYDPGWIYTDWIVDALGISQAVAAGNCGVQESFYTNCGDGPHRVVTPANGFNILAVGARVAPSADSSTWSVWPHSSTGPTFDGRKKPDLVASPSGAAGSPRYWDVDNNGKMDDYGSVGLGTSFAAPQVAAGAALLAAAGIYSPIAQRALLINTAKPIQNQTYWTPTSGWGALDLERAYYERGNWQMSNITGTSSGTTGPNTARFFRITGTAVGDRTTLTWNRRSTSFMVAGAHYYDLTNLDLSQISPADSTGATVTSTGGSDAADTVDTNQTPTPNPPGTNALIDNPMPGSGEDGEDNVEQVRSTATGTQLLKVKAKSPVDQQSSEPFALASQRPITALATPIPNVSIESDVAAVKVGDTAQITVTATNPSDDLSLSDAQVTLAPLPAGVSIVGAPTQSLGTLSGGSPQTRVFTVQGSADGFLQLTARVSGTAYGEDFEGASATNFTVDTGPPIVDLTPLPQWSTVSTPTATWSASDTLTAVASYDAEQKVAGESWQPLLTEEQITSVDLLSAEEGQLVSVRVRARDTLGNTSDWSTASTTIDAISPDVAIGEAISTGAAQIRVPVSSTNLGAPIVSTLYRFDSYPYDTGQRTSLSDSASYTNYLSNSVRATLYVWATDALGRVSAAQKTFVVEGNPGKTLRPVPIRIRSAKVKKRRLTLIGTVPSSYWEDLRVTVTRRGRTGTKKVTRRVEIDRGRWRATIRLKKGAYTVTISGPKESGGNLYAAGKTTRKIRVR